MFKKILAFFLCIAIVFSFCCVPVLAAKPTGRQLLADSTSVSAWDSWLNANILKGIELGVFKPGEIAITAIWQQADDCMSAAGFGECADPESLETAKDNWNGYLRRMTPQGFFNQFIYTVVATTFDIPLAVIDYDPDLGVYRLKEFHSNLWLVNSSGHFPYYRPDNVEAVERIGQWIHDDAIKTDSALWHTVIGADLSAYIETWPDRSCKIEDRGDYYWIVWVDSSSRPSKRMILCDDYGYPYYVPKPKQTAVTTPNNYYTEQGDSYTDDSTNVNVYDQGSVFLDSILDVENGILNVGGEAYYADQVTYDDSTKTYYVDSHDQYIWNPVTNNYTTNNYKWEITYNIDYTSVTYIGETEEYEERYEYYYELPDGRSSADLTREDLEQLSVVFADVILYARSADDADMRALYHFDGNTEDSSYWSYTRHGFDWKTGASLTYMDEGIFDGSLYLDETEHQFEISLPGRNDAGEDWTLQFRYYQSHTEVPVQDSYLSVGGDPLLYFTGSQYLDKNSAVICASSVGTWNEICLVRSSGQLLYFINGVYYKALPDSYHSSVLSFNFGSSQQTYKKIDELRFTKGALYGTSGYTPTAVPFDTNLSLVLPDSSRPIADEVMVFTKSNNNLLDSVGLSDWRRSDVLSHVAEAVDYNYWKDECSDGHWYRCTCQVLHGLQMFRGSGAVLSTGVDGGVILSNTYSTVSVTKPASSMVGHLLVHQQDGLFLPVAGYTSTTNYDNVPLSAITYWEEQGGYDPQSPGFAGSVLAKNDVTYCFSVLLADGTFSYITFDRCCNIVDTVNNSTVQLSLAQFGNYVDREPYDLLYGKVFGISVFPAFGSSEIVYMELVEGSAPEFSVSWESAFYPEEQLTQSPILAVRSNRPITSYQIGGVRPSYPEKGQVYATVENNRITSLQQYTGFVWEAVDGRIWTGSRWIPYSSFDVKTMQDYWDIEGSSEDDYFYTESGFWSWFQKQWKVFMEKLDKVVYYLRESQGLPEESDCKHVYQGEETPPSCSTPGGTVYTCELCGDVLLESTPALGHDWVVIEDLPSEFNLPEDAHCPDCSTADFTYELNSTQDEFICKCTSCGREWKETPDVTWGYTNSKCTRCGVIQTESKDPSNNGIFTALGNFLSDGIGWILDKLTQLVESISGIQDTFKDFAERMKENVGAYPAFLAAAIAVLPGDLMDVIWFAVISLVAIAVFKKFTR